MIINIIVAIIIVVLIFKLFGKGLDLMYKSHNENEFRRGYNYALHIYNQYAKDEEGHDLALKRIYEESDIGFEFAGNDQYDCGMRSFYHEKRNLGFVG